MPFNVFRELFAEAKRLKLIDAFNKINKKFQESKWIFKCCCNYKTMKELYFHTLTMVTNACSFLSKLLESNHEIELKPACYHHAPSMGGLDYLVMDFQLLLDWVLKSLDTRVIYEHANFDGLFELVHILYKLLKSFRTKYISKVHNEQ